MIHKFKKYLPILFAFFLGSIVSTATTIVLAHGGNTNYIHACVKNSNGSVKIVGTNDACASGETALDWSKNGLGIKGGYITDQLIGMQSQYETFDYRSYDGFNFSNSNLYLPTMHYASFVNSNFTNVDIIEPDVTSTNFQNSNFTGTLLEGGYALRNSDFSGSNFTNTHFESGEATNSNFDNSNFTNAILNGNFATSSFVGTTWSNTTCPDATNSDNNGNTCEGHLTP